jgi:hypothetical protein
MTSGRWIAAPPHRRSFAALTALAFTAVGLAARTDRALRPGHRRAAGRTGRLDTGGRPGRRRTGRAWVNGRRWCDGRGRRRPAPARRPSCPSSFCDPELGVARRQLPADANIVTNALDSLLAGPSEAETGAGLSTAIPDLTRVRGTGLMGDVLVVNLSGSFSALGPQFSSELRVAQIVYTVSVFPVRVLFQIDGQPARAIGGFILPDRPVTRDDFASWAPPVLVETIGLNERLTPTTPISGSTAAAGTGVGIRHRRGRQRRLRRIHDVREGSRCPPRVRDRRTVHGRPRARHADRVRAQPGAVHAAARADHPGPARIAPPAAAPPRTVTLVHPCRPAPRLPACRRRPRRPWRGRPSLVPAPRPTPQPARSIPTPTSRQDSPAALGGGP